MRIRYSVVWIFLSIGALVQGQTPIGESPPAIKQSVGAAKESHDPQAEERRAQIERLIGQLGDGRFDVREAATKSLTALGSRARAQLERATTNADLEIAFRAKAILEGLPKLTHTIVDALGLPIAQATVTVKVSNAPPTEGDVSATADPPSTFTVSSEDDGRIGIPEIASGDVRVMVIVQHPEYGSAQSAVETGEGKTVIQLPIVRRGTEAYRRSVSGQVVDPAGEPIAGAVVHCSEIRTPGEGLIQGKDPRGEALSDKDGRFTLYLPNEDTRSERGVLIPANSRYRLQITVPGNDSFFPMAGRYSNVEPVHIEVPRVTHFHRFRFEAVDGGWIHDEQQLRQVHVQYEGQQNGERMLIDLGNSAVREGRKLLAGRYAAQSFASGNAVEYLPLAVSDASPEELSFSLPHAVTYRGRVVDGVTGAPVADALVMGWNSTAHNNLALLTADDWKMLREVPSNPPLDHPAVRRLREFYGVQGLVRTDREGRFEIIRQPDQDFYGLMAFSENSVPFKVRVGPLKPDSKHRVDAGEFPLFPAARIVVRPVFGGERLAVAPRWVPADAGQPEWYERFQNAGRSSDREFEYVHWLTLNESQPVLVPASIRLRVRFETPYDDKWDAAVVEAIQLEPGATKEIGDLQFSATLPVAVRVIDRQGRSVEGVPVRQKYLGDNAWSVAHNTDRDGLAQFHAPRNSQGQFWVSDLPGPQELRFAENLLTRFKVGNESPASPFTITITDAQSTLLLGNGKAP